MSFTPGNYAKAYTAAAVTAGATAGAISTAPLPELIKYGAIGGAFIVAFLSTWLVPNAAASDPKVEPDASSDSTPLPTAPAQAAPVMPDADLVPVAHPDATAVDGEADPLVPVTSQEITGA